MKIETARGKHQTLYIRMKEGGNASIQTYNFTKYKLFKYVFAVHSHTHTPKRAFKINSRIDGVVATTLTTSNNVETVVCFARFILFVFTISLSISISLALTCSYFSPSISFEHIFSFTFSHTCNKLLLIFCCCCFTNTRVNCSAFVLLLYLEMQLLAASCIIHVKN